MSYPAICFLLVAAFVDNCWCQECGVQDASRPDCVQSVAVDHDGELFLLQTEVAVNSRYVKSPARAESAARKDGIHHGKPWSFYNFIAIPLLMITLVVAWFTRPQLDSSCDATTVNDPRFRNHRFRFLVVWATCVAADWLQGPYVYALYDSFGYSSSDINKLFVIGFGSSAIFGTFVGSLADAWGRKRCALLYCVLYIVSCAVTHVNQFPVLVLGRIAGGIATSLLFSTFECWMVAEHNERHQFSGALLRYMFSMMYFVNYLVAIFSGLVAQSFVSVSPLRRVEGFESVHFGGNTCAYDLAICMLCVAIPLIGSTWDENYGDQESKQTPMESYKAALRALISDWKLASIGIIIACFEGSMYAFIINWTPALSIDGAPTPPHGLVFSTMMMCCMMGASLFSFFSAKTNPAKVTRMACVVSIFCFGIAGVLSGLPTFASGIYVSFLCFEASVGAYFPSIGALKSEVVPEEVRAGIYNFYRIPLNIVVVSIILTDMSVKTTFLTCTALLAVATAILMVIVSTSKPNKFDSSQYECS
jgi:MFS family permease